MELKSQVDLKYHKTSKRFIFSPESNSKSLETVLPKKINYE